MRLFIMRHGQAEPGGECSDEERQLTSAGIAELATTTKGLWSLGVSVELIAHSPLVRTVQTAEIVGKGLGPDTELLKVPSLAPGASPEGIYKEIVGLSRFKSLMIVGHAPDVSGICHYLITTQYRGSLDFAPASVACIEFPGAAAPGEGKILWFMSANQLKDLVEG